MSTWSKPPALTAAAVFSAILTACGGGYNVITTTPDFTVTRTPLPESAPTLTTSDVWQSQLFGTCERGEILNTANNTRTNSTTLCKPTNPATQVFNGTIRTAATGFYHLSNGQNLDATGMVIYACPAPGQPITFKHIPSGAYLPEVKQTVPRGCVAVAENILVPGLNGYVPTGPSLIVRDRLYRQGVMKTQTPQASY